MNSHPLHKLTFLQKMVIMYIPSLLVWDAIVASTRGNEYIPIIRGLYSIIYVFVLLLGTDFKRRFTRQIWYFTFYLLLILFFADNMIYSANLISKTALSMFCLVIGYKYMSDIYAFNALAKSLFFINVILLVNYAVDTIFGFSRGWGYSQDIQMGSLNSWYVFMTVCQLAPLYYLNKRSKFNLLFYNAMLIGVIVLILLSFKRTVWIALTMGFAVFVYYQRKVLPMIKYLILISAVLLLLYPLYDHVFQAQYRARERQLDLDVVQTEARYMEYPIVWQEIFSFQDPAISLFGLDPFNGIGRYGGGAFSSRGLHTDINLVLYTTGIVGFLLYLMIYVQLAFAAGGISRKPISREYLVYQGVWWSLFVSSVAVSFSGGMMGLTYRSILFLFLGAITGRLEKEKGYLLLKPSIYTLVEKSV